MITLPWWGLLLLALGVFVAGQLVGVAALLSVAVRWDRRKKDLGKRYPEGAD